MLDDEIQVKLPLNLLNDGDLKIRMHKTGRQRENSSSAIQENIKKIKKNAEKKEHRNAGINSDIKEFKLSESKKQS
jgi:hypothetical protein